MPKSDNNASCKNNNSTTNLCCCDDDYTLDNSRDRKRVWKFGENVIDPSSIIYLVKFHSRPEAICKRDISFVSRVERTRKFNKSLHLAQDGDSPQLLSCHEMHMVSKFDAILQ